MCHMSIPKGSIPEQVEEQNYGELANVIISTIGQVFCGEWRHSLITTIITIIIDVVSKTFLLFSVSRHKIAVMVLM